MLEITIPSGDRFDETTRTFITLKKDVKISLEHSLISISRWESMYKRPYLSKDRGPQNGDEILDYIKCMTITQNVDPMAYYFLSRENLEAINKYIGEDQTATTFRTHKIPRRGRSETVTSELIYYWMFSMGIPKECERWHISRLFTLIHVFDVKNSKPKKRSKKEMIAERNALNKARRAKYNTSG